MLFVENEASYFLGWKRLAASMSPRPSDIQAIEIRNPSVWVVWTENLKEKSFRESNCSNVNDP
jgi:hypothetical protein